MSSSYIRSAIKVFLSDNTSEKVVDLTGHYEELEDLLTAQSISMTDDWLGLQFIGNDEVPITIGSNNTTGKYRETGGLYFHVVSIAKLGVSDTILSRVETLRDLFRGRKIGTIFIDSVTPVNFEAGAALRFEDGYLSGSFIVGYTSDLDL